MQAFDVMVGHVRGMPMKSERAVYIGRANSTYQCAESPLHNPYHIGKDGTRDEVIAKFEKKFKHDIQHDTPMRAEFIRLLEILERTGTLWLYCWCCPQACHGDVIKRGLLWFAGNPERKKILGI